MLLKDLRAFIEGKSDDAIINFETKISIMEPIEETAAEETIEVAEVVATQDAPEETNEVTPAEEIVAEVAVEAAAE